MDRLFSIRFEDSEPFTDGNCILCNQCNVKVRQLRCGKHSYCRMCQDFVPRLIRGDFSCTKCCTKFQKQEAESLLNVEKFLAKQTEVSWPDDVESPNQRDACPTFMKQIDDAEADDDSDLEGGNAEWDYLLQPIDEKEEDDAKNSLIGGMYPTPRKEATGGIFSPIPRKSSYMRLGLPSANFDYVHDENQPSTSKQPIPISKTVTELLNPPKYAVLPAYIPASSKCRRSSSESDSSSRSSGSYHKAYETENREARKISSSSDSFMTDPEEKERGTSPCKRPRPRHQTEWCTMDKSKHHSSTEDSENDLTRENEDIEGPVSDSSDDDASVEVLVNEDDSFWDI